MEAVLASTTTTAVAVASDLITTALPRFVIGSDAPELVGEMALSAIISTSRTISTSNPESTIMNPATTLIAEASAPVTNTLTYAIKNNISGLTHAFSPLVPGFMRQLWLWQPTFMQGFLLGQLSMLMLLIMAVKYILFEEPLRTQPQGQAPTKRSEAADDGSRTTVLEGGFGLSKFMVFTRKSKETKPTSVAEEMEKMRKSILQRTGYDLSAHGAESCDWLTVFLAQLTAKLRADAERHDILVREISEALNGELRPSILDSIRITQFSLGSDFVQIARARMVPCSATPLGMRAEVDFELEDEITLGFDTRVLVNWPRSTFAALPVSMVVSVVKFAGTLAVEFDSASPEPSISFTVLPDYVLDFDVQTLVGSKAKVQNLPMLTSVISRKLQAAFANELVLPNRKHVKIKHPFSPKPQADEPAHTSHPTVPDPDHSNTPESAHAVVSDSSLSPEALNPESPPRLSSLGDLPPDYNTQLPPPHYMRSVQQQQPRTASHPLSMPANEIPHTTNENISINNSPQASAISPRVYMPDEPSLLNPQQAKPWSTTGSMYALSPQLRPMVIGMNSGTASPMGNFHIYRNGSKQSAGLQMFANRQASHGKYIHAENNSDQLQVKDSVRKRVNRVIKTVNES